MICSTCGEESPTGARFCMHCATPLPLACDACGGAIPQEARFCPGCAAPVGEGAKRDTVLRKDTARRPRDYTPRHLAEKILQSKSALEGERKQVTVMFADVKGSMELAEQFEPETWHQILDRFFQILSDGVHRFEGTVNQYTGDGIMALFGAPIAHEDHAARACYAALWLKDRLRDYADEVRRTRGASFSVRIGLNSGEVVVGKIGDDLRMDYTAQGLTVGLAQRMESLAPGDSAYLTEHTARWAEGFFDLRSLGDFDIKGVSQPVGVFELQGTGQLRTRLELSRQRGFSRFVGRGNELSTLDAALERTLDGGGGVVGVVADAGVGKSRLCLEFLERCRARDVAVFQAHCPAHGRLIPLLPIVELLRDFYGLTDEDGEQVSREKIAGRLLLLDRSLEDSMHLAFDFMGVADPQQPQGDMDPKQKQRANVVFARRLVQAISRRAPSVVLVDDVHWIDAASDEFLAEIAETVKGSRMLLLLNFRPEYTAQWMGDAGYQQLPLRPLGSDAIRELATHLLGSDESTRALPPLLAERSGGNPFFVEEIVQMLVESGRLVGDRGNYRLEGKVGALEVPSSVSAILAARIDRLRERDKVLLQTAAAIGRVFSDPLLRRVADLPDVEFDDAIAALRRAEMIREESLYPVAEYAFRHPLTHEVALGSQLADARRRVHARIARALEELHSDRLDEEAALLAHHFDEAGLAEPAALYHRRAAERIAGGAPAAAQAHWYRVRDLADEIDDGALALELGQQSRLMILEYGWRLGVTEEEANALIAEGEAWSERRGDARALAALYNAACIPLSHSLGQVDRATEMAERGFALAQQVGDEVLAFTLQLRLFFVVEAAGQGNRAREVMDACQAYPLEVMEEASALIGYDAPSAPLGFEGWLNMSLGRFADVLEHVRRGAARAREHGSIEVVGWMRTAECLYFTAVGDPARGARAGREALEIAEQSESLLALTLGCDALSRYYLAIGDLDAAQSLAERVLDQQTTAVASIQPTVLCTLARIALARGSQHEARTMLERAERVARGRFRRGEIDVSVALAELALAEDEPDACRQAGAHLDRAEAAGRETGTRSFVPNIAILRARIAEHGGDRAGARAALRDAIAFWEGCGVTTPIGRLEAEIARLGS